MKELQNQLIFSRSDPLPLVDENLPWLLMSHGDDFESQTFFSTLQNRYLSPQEIHELKGSRVWPTPHGWLVLDNPDTRECCLLNPVSMESIGLPQLEEEENYVRCLLTKPPTDLECRVLFVATKNNALFFCRPGDREFIKQTSIFDGDKELYTAAVFGDKVYGMTLTGYTFVALEFQGKNLEIKPLMKLNNEGVPSPWGMPDLLPPGEGGFFNNYLIESGGELLMVHKRYSNATNPTLTHADEKDEGEDTEERDVEEDDDEEEEEGMAPAVERFRIFKLDVVEREWMELDSIGDDRALFMDHCGGLSCALGGDQPLHVRGNCVYYSELMDDNLYAYDMANKQTSRWSIPCPPASTGFSLKCWVRLMH